MAALTAWMQSCSEVLWTSVTEKGVILCMKAQGDHPFLRAWDHSVQNTSLGWT